MINKIAATDSIKQQLSYLRKEVVYSALGGNYKNFKVATKEHAKLAVNNYDIAKQVKSPKITVPIFSKYGFNLLKVMVLNFFRKKSPEENLLRKIAKEEKIKNDVNSFMK